MGVARLDMTRKTSLLRKIGPLARRSSFANKVIYNSPSSHDEDERRNDLEIAKGRAIACTIQLGSISSLRCQKSRNSTALVRAERLRNDVFADDVVTGDPIGKQLACRAEARGNQSAYARWAPARQPCSLRERRLVEPDGIEPTTSCLQSTRSPS